MAYVAAGTHAPAGPVGAMRIAHPVEGAGELHLFYPVGDDDSSHAKFVARVAGLMVKAVTLQDRTSRLQRLAITDDLTGLYNGRYFRHSLARLMEHAKKRQSILSLLIFDIDNFKHYNDQFGHSVGDEILKQTAVLIKRCVREHDHVARIGGDEFAVIFWEKDVPRQAHHENAGTPGKPPPIEAILERFRGMLATQDLSLLGCTGKGSLTISGGVAKFPWDAHTPEDLITAADEKLMFGAKKSGKNSIKLVGGEEG